MSSLERPISIQALMQLLAVSRQLAAPTDLDALLRLVIDVGRDVVGAERGSVLLYDVVHRELYAKVATGAGGIRVTIDSGIAGACARARKLVNVRDVDNDPRFNAETDRTTGFRTRSVVAVPLIGL